MSSKKRRKQNRGFYGDNFWESADYNFRTFNKNFDLLLTLAINRFKWINLPNSCDAGYFERVLHRNGIASFSHVKNDNVPVFHTLNAAPFGTYNMYGYPTQWRAIGYDGLTDYEVDLSNGELCYYSTARINPWNALEIYSRKMTHYERTEDVNLTQQMKPFIGIAPREKQLELVNLIKQTQGGEPAILGDDGLLDMVNKVKVLDTKVPIVTEELAQGYQNTLNQALMYLGIPHLAFEKGERMIETEARANTSPTEIMLLDCLSARRMFCDKVNEKFGLDIQVIFNTDLESYNFNYLNNFEAMAQDNFDSENDTNYGIEQTDARRML